MMLRARFSGVSCGNSFMTASAVWVSATPNESPLGATWNSRKSAKALPLSATRRNERRYLNLEPRKPGRCTLGIFSPGFLDSEFIPSGEAVFCPRISRVAVAAHFPEAGFVLGGEFDRA